MPQKNVAKQLLLLPCYSPNDVCLNYTCCRSHDTLRTMYASLTPVAAAILFSEQCMSHLHRSMQPCYSLRTMYVSPTPVAAAILLSEQCMSHLHRSCIHATLRTMYVSPIPVAAAMLLSEQCMSLQQLLLEPCYSPNNMCLTYTSSCSHATLRTMCPVHP